MIADGVTDWDTLTRCLPRNAQPAVLSMVWRDLEAGELARAAAEAWQMCEFPENALDTDDWLEILDATGYLVNGKSAAPPAGPVQLYRGGIDPERMAWTADRAQAEWFRDRFPGGRLWTATATAGALLMHFDGTDGRDGETEYVVYPEFIECTEVV